MTRIDTPEMQEKIIQLYEAKVTISEICKTLYISHPIVSRVVKERGLKPRIIPPDVVDKITPDVLKDYAENNTITMLQLADKYDVNKSTIHRIFLKNGIKNTHGGTRNRGAKPATWRNAEIIAECWRRSRTHSQILKETGMTETEYYSAYRYAKKINATQYGVFFIPRGKTYD